MMLKQNRLNGALSINLFLLWPPFAHFLISSSRLGKPVLSPGLTEQHIVDHLLVCLAVAVGQRGKRMSHLCQKSVILASIIQRLTISRTHLSLYMAPAAAVLPGPAAAPCMVPALACNGNALKKRISALINYLHWSIEISGIGMWLFFQSWNQHLKDNISILGTGKKECIWK